MEANIKFYAPYNETLGDYVSPPADVEDYSTTPWANLAIETTDKKFKFGLGSLKYIVNDILLNSNPDSYYSGLYYTFDSSLDTDDFTIHCWVKFPKCPGVFWQINNFMCFSSLATWDMYPSNADPQEPRNFITYDAKITFKASGYYNGEDGYLYDLPLTDNTSSQPTNWLYDTDAWHHLAFTISAGNAYAFMDGILKSTIAVTGSNTLAGVDSWLNLVNWNDWWYFGGWYVHVYSYAPEKAVGLIDEHIISSEALWTADFTPPTTELLGGAPVRSATKLLLHMNDDDDFVDSSTEQHAVTVDGPTHSTETFRLGTASGEFDNLDKLLVLDEDNWNIFSSDWTIDFWLNIKSTSEHDTYNVFAQTLDGSNYMYGKYSKSAKTFSFKLVVGGRTRIDIVASMDLTQDTWHHIALTASSFNPVKVT